MMEKPPRLERKKRIKDQNAKRKGKRRAASSDFPRTPEEFDRQMEGCMQIVFGLLKVAGINPQELIEKANRKAEEFPEPANNLVN